MKSGFHLYKQTGILSFFSVFAITSFAQKEKKNILFLMADDFNYWTSAQGYYPYSQTPNIDGLASKGMLFTDAHCSSPVSNPSRNALWSGFRPSTTGIQGNQDGYIRGIAGFANIKTMNQYFKENGYWVYGAGKLYHPSTMSDGEDKDQINWSQRYTGATGCNGGAYLSWQNPGWSAMSYSVNSSQMTESNCADYKMVNAVAKVIQDYATSANKDKPFFIGCGVFRPHLPWNMPKEFWDKFNTEQLTIPEGYKAGDLDDISWNTTSSAHSSVVLKGKWKESIHAYLASLALADYNIGVLLNALESSPYKDNTIVCFMGDHGWHLGEKEKWGKNTLFDAANRTTLIIYDPSAMGNGQICRKVVSLQDLYPTLVELSGVPLKTDIEGNSLVPLLEDPVREDWDKPVVMSYADVDYIKTNQWRYVRDASNKQMLYDVQHDPYEFTNLRYNNQYTTVVTRLNTQLDSMISIGKSLKNKLLANYHFFPQKLTIPGRIEAEDYDEGGYDQTYHDVDYINEGNSYRIADGVDIYVTDDASGSFHLGNARSGEWCLYSVSDYVAGKYAVDVRVKNPGMETVTLQLFNRVQKLAELSIPSTNGQWQTYRIPEIELSKQEPSARLKFVVSSGNNLQINWFQFESISTLNPGIRANNKRKCLEYNVIVNGILMLDLSNSDPSTRLTIYDVKGQEMCREVVPGEQKLAYHIPVSLSKGSYLIQVSDENNWSLERFLVK